MDSFAIMNYNGHLHVPKLRYYNSPAQIKLIAFAIMDANRMNIYFGKISVRSKVMHAQE